MIQRTLESLRKRAFLLPKIDPDTLIIALVLCLCLLCGMLAGLLLVLIGWYA